MLKEFRVANFKSIRNEQTFTMEACSKNEVSEYPDHVVEKGGNRLLKVASIYGPNGGGKSNLFKALNTFALISLSKPVLNDSLKEENYFPCVFCKNKNTTFTLFFITDDYEIGYTIEVDLNNIIQSLNPASNSYIYLLDYKIEKEEMVARPLDKEDFRTLYKRDRNGIVVSEDIGDIDLIRNKTPLSKNNTFINYYCSTFGLSNNNILAKPLFEFSQELSSYVLLKKETMVLRFLKHDVDHLTQYLEKTREALNVLDFRIEKLYFKEVESGIYYLYIVRKASDGAYTEIPLQNESKGTIKAINIVLLILFRSNIQLVIGDDFDSFLHPKLIRVIIELFTSKDNNSKQLIINSHDMTNMNNKVFRRDEIWFAYRDDDYSTIYQPLSNIVDYKGNMVRKDAVYGKQYLEGRYGADPFIEKGLRWNND